MNQVSIMCWNNNFYVPQQVFLANSERSLKSLMAGRDKTPRQTCHEQFFRKFLSIPFIKFPQQLQQKMFKGTWNVYISPLSSTSDKDTVLPDLAGSTLLGVVAGSGAANSCSMSTILCMCSSSLVSRISREVIDFLPVLDWLTDSLYISWS